MFIINSKSNINSTVNFTFLRKTNKYITVLPGNHMKEVPSNETRKFSNINE